MTPCSTESGPPSRYGLVRNLVCTRPVPGATLRARTWLEARDEIDGYLLDIVDAFEHRRLDRSAFEREQRRLTLARRLADRQLRRALSDGDRPHPSENPRRLR